MRPSGILVPVLLVVSGAAVPAADLPEAVRILRDNCLACHGQSQMSGLDLRTQEGLLAGGKRGPSIVPGDAAASLLYQAVCCDDNLRMPLQGERLPATEISALREWIDSGADWPSGHSVEGPEAWWSLKPVSRPPVPPDGDGWSRNPIDQFIARGLSSRDLLPAPEADRRSWIRRATFDLHGLPPTPSEIEVFLEDDSERAFEAVVDRLLESERYGERWGRHWLDVVRYADSGGFETDIYFRDAWRYRDYVIQSFNNDKPFDVFIREQVAGDEFWPNDLELRGTYDIPEEKQRHLEARIGTGMYTVGTVYHEAALNGQQLRYEWMVDAVDVTGEAFLGMTVGCARCHDHKFDPISQQDYHGLMAFFEGTEIRRVPVVSKMSEFGYYSSYPKQLKVFEHQEAIKRLDAAVRQRVVESIASTFDSEIVQAFRVPRTERSVEQQVRAAILERALTEAGLLENPGGYAQDLPYTPQERDRRKSLVMELGRAAAVASFELPMATILGRADVSYPVHMTDRGDWRSTGAEVPAQTPAVFRENSRMASQGGRRALADWLADPSHPLVARVMVNRIWQGHFGRGLVGTPNDFGRQGDRPSHPELLDWLAAEFVRQGWSIKAMHRMIMDSSAYRMSSRVVQASVDKDPGNRYLWRMNRRRLDAESLRDAVLAVSGTLNLKTGGRPVLPPLSEEERLGMWDRDDWPESLDPSEHLRRSVYIFAKRQFPYPMFKTFDVPDPAASCGRRDVTTVAPQALTLLNSDVMVESARSLARRLEDSGSPEDQVAMAWKLALGRQPDPEENARAAHMLAEAGPVEFGMMLFNLNEFVYID